MHSLNSNMNKTSNEYLSMAMLTIRNLDDDVKRRLRRRAAKHGCSMEEEARQILRQALSGKTPEKGLASRIHQRVLDTTGGLMRTNIPRFRLPPQVLDEEINYIIDMGVDLKLNHRIESMKELLDSGEFDAVFVGTGAPRGKNLEIRKQADGIHLVVDSHGTHYDEVVERLLLAVGRTPNVEGLNLEAAGVAYDKKGVQVNERLQTTNRRIYAAGDICFPYKFTHTADATARIVIQNALFFGRSKSDALTVPWCTYTDPEVAHVGLYPREAEEKGIAVDTITVAMNTVDRAILEGDDDGFLDVYVKKGTDEILGATMVCRHAGDMISEITVAMAAGAGLGTIARTIHPYPTQAEAIKKAGDAYNRTRLTPRVQKIFDTLLKWRR